MPNVAGIARSETQVAMDLADETTLNPSEYTAGRARKPVDCS